MNLAYKSLLEIKELIDSGEISSREVWEYFKSRSEELNNDLGVFLSIGPKEFEEKNNTPLS